MLSLSKYPAKIRYFSIRAKFFVFFPIFTLKIIIWTSLLKNYFFLMLMH